jgi:cold shock CspA family protein/ribosome-associated translation inhibitor RaiA
MASKFVEVLMQTPLRIDFHGAETSEALERAITEHVARLEAVFGRLTACHVTVRAPGHHHRKGGLYEIDIHVTLPGGQEIAVTRTPQEDARHADLEFAVNDAFRRAKRTLQDHVRAMQGQVKAHEEQPLGTILSYDDNRGFGFLRAADGHEVYFNKNSVIGEHIHLSPGTRVRFHETMGEKGPQASTVHLLGLPK